MTMTPTLWVLLALLVWLLCCVAWVSVACFRAANRHYRTACGDTIERDTCRAQGQVPNPNLSRRAPPARLRPSYPHHRQVLPLQSVGNESPQRLAGHNATSGTND